MESKPNNHGSAGEFSKDNDREDDSDRKSKKKTTRAPLGLPRSFGSESKSADDSKEAPADKKKDSSIESSSAAVSAWRNLVKNTEAAVPKESKESEKAETIEDTPKVDETPAEVQAESNLEDELKAETEEQAETKPKSHAEAATENEKDDVAEQPKTATPPPLGPPPVGWAAGERPSQRSEQSPEAANETVASETVADEPEAARSEAEAAREALASRRFAATAPEAVLRGNAGGPEGPTPPTNTNERLNWFMNNRGENGNDNARTPGDVRRAAVAGVVIGWALGRRGKKKAVQRAIDATKKRLQPVKKFSFWKPNHDKYKPERFKQQPTTSQSAERPVAARWLNPEVKSTAASKLTAERLASTPLTEALAVPAAAAALRVHAERQPKLAGAEKQMNETQLVEMARTIEIKGISLQKIYESKQIDQEGLRSVIAAYLRGESVEKQLNKAITEKQKSFERDPYSRRSGQENKASNLRKAAGQVGDVLTSTGAGIAHGSQFVASKVGQGVSTAASSVSSASSNVKSTIKSPASISHRSTGNEGNNSGSVFGIIAVVIIYALILILWLTR